MGSEGVYRRIAQQRRRGLNFALIPGDSGRNNPFDWNSCVGFIRHGFIRQTGLGLFRRSFLRIEGELALPLICNNLLAV